MRELDKNFVYDLSELNSEELQQVFDFLRTEDGDWIVLTFKNFKEGLDYARLAYVDNGWVWVYQEPTANAKELFYTLENIQVDCSELTEEQIKEMCKVYESDGYKQWIDPEAFIIIDNFTYLRIDSENEFYITGGLDTKNTITYDKFMELFGGQEVLKPTLSQYFKDLTPIDNPPFIKADSLGYIGQIVDNEEESSAVTPEEIVKYLSKKDIFLTPKQYKKLWKKS